MQKTRLPSNLVLDWTGASFPAMIRPHARESKGGINLAETRESKGPVAVPQVEVMDLRVNGARHRVETNPDRSLLSVLRDDLDLTGTKYGCGEGQCGACTVLVNGRPTRSCITRVRSATGKQITTVEGLEKNGKLHPVQEAFIETGAMQCGYCTSGMILAAVALLKKHADPREEEILRYMNGNVCRCGTYPRITAAIRLAAQRMKGSAR